MIRTLTLNDTSIISYYYFTIIYYIIIVNTALRDTVKDITRLPMLLPFICVALSLPFPRRGKLTAQNFCSKAQPSALTTTVCRAFPGLSLSLRLRSRFPSLEEPSLYLQLPVLCSVQDPRLSTVLLP